MSQYGRRRVLQRHGMCERDSERAAQHESAHRDHHQQNRDEHRGPRDLGMQGDRSDSAGDQSAHQAREVANQAVPFVPHARETGRAAPNFVASASQPVRAVTGSPVFGLTLMRRTARPEPRPRVSIPLRASSFTTRSPRIPIVVTDSARQTRWVSATIDPRDPNLFGFEPRIVPANVG